MEAIKKKLALLKEERDVANDKTEEAEQAKKEAEAKLEDVSVCVCVCVRAHVRGGGWVLVCMLIHVHNARLHDLC